MFYRGVIVPGGKVAHESLRLRCKFQWEHKCLLVLMVWFLYSSGDWLACFKCKRGMYFSKFSGSLNETCFYYGFSASSYAQGWLENYGIFFVYRALAYGTLRRSSCLFRLPTVRAKSKWGSWTVQNPIFWSGSCVVRIWWSPLDRGIWNRWLKLYLVYFINLLWCRLRTTDFVSSGVYLLEPAPRFWCFASLV